MLIDWFTVGAQVLNFLILVWLLKHFLYKPILDAIDAREQLIAAELGRAAAQQTAADKERDEFRDKSKTLDEQRDALMTRAGDDAKTEHDRLLAEAHGEADALRAQQETAIRNDQSRLAREIARMANGEVFAIARKALADLAAANLEERMGEVFVRRLREMDAKARGALAAALGKSSEPAVLRSTFDMPDKDRAVIQKALNETFSADIRVRFETVPDGICGVELTANGQKLAWSIGEYLAELEQHVGSLLDSALAPAPAQAVVPAPALAPAAPATTPPTAAAAAHAATP
jgi:F-type H+-transporting ATPase subunit b